VLACFEHAGAQVIIGGGGSGACWGDVGGYQIYTVLTRSHVYLHSHTPTHALRTKARMCVDMLLSKL